MGLLVEKEVIMEKEFLEAVKWVDQEMKRKRTEGRIVQEQNNLSQLLGELLVE